MRLGLLLGLGALVALHAESNGVYVGGGFQAGRTEISRTSPLNVSHDDYRNNYGFGVQVGYKYFFKRWFGLRSNVFFDYNHTNQFNPINSGFFPFFYTNRGFNNITYGVSLDGIFNFYHTRPFTLGIITGFQLAGSNWFSQNQIKITTLNTRSGTFQFLFNLGIHTQFGKHHGLDFGIKIPTIREKYATYSANKSYMEALQSSLASVANSPDIQDQALVNQLKDILSGYTFGSNQAKINKALGNLNSLGGLQAHQLYDLLDQKVLRPDSTVWLKREIVYYINYTYSF